MVQVVECLLSKCKALSSISSTGLKKKIGADKEVKKRERERERETLDLITFHLPRLLLKGSILWLCFSTLLLAVPVLAGHSPWLY
jgi:hypothetical protein